MTVCVTSRGLNVVVRANWVHTEHMPVLPLFGFTMHSYDGKA